ncbi:MAG TPA: tetratricopeptide repeat protein, partial [bacterium]|nr:tetratricopeptide repeat protein [bacterium]
MNEKGKIISALILILLLGATIIWAEEKVPILQITIEETAELIQADPKLAVEFYKFLARTYTRAKRYEEAARTYQKALEIIPKDENLRLTLAHLYDWQIKDPQRAALEYEKLIEINPEKSRYYTRLSEIYFQADLKDRAILFMEKVAKDRPDDAYVHSKLGQLYLSRGMYSKAVRTYKEAIRLKPDAAVFHLYLARAYAGGRRDEEAFKEYLAAIDVEEERGIIDEEACNEFGVYDIWGAILVRAEHLGILPRLTKKFKKKVTQHPNNSLLRKDLARIYAWKGDYEKAIIQCYEAIRLNPKDNVAWYRLGRIYERKKEFIKALQAYLRIVVRNLGGRGWADFTVSMRSNEAAINKIKKIAEKRVLYSQAIEMVEEAVEKKPTRLELLILLGDLYRGGRRYEEAIKTYQRVIEIEPGMSFRIYHNIADVYTENKEYEKTITAYGKILTLSQSDSMLLARIEALKKMFLVYEKMSRVEEKLREYEKKIAREPENIELYQELGGVYEALKRWEEGSRLYLKALEIAPQNREIKRGSRIFAYQCKRNGALKAALPLYEKFREREPARTQYTIALIEIYTGLGEKEKARSLLG